MDNKQSYSFDWAELAFGSKKPVNDLKASFILAPRQLSAKRFTQLIKTYLPGGNIVLGIAKEPYIMGFESQPQFETLKTSDVQPMLDKVNASASPYKVYVLHYQQRDTNYLLEKLNFKQVVLVNGSWHYSFHTKDWYYTLVNKQTPYTLVTPFYDEAEARAYAAKLAPLIDRTTAISSNKNGFNDTKMLAAAGVAAKRSYDYSYQTGLAVGQKQTDSYKLLLTAHNTVVPFETYAMHYGNSREKYFSPPHDLNHYDTVHAEISVLNLAIQQRISLAGASLFINLLPCPTCARALAASNIAEIVYSADHSEGYAVHLLETAGKLVRRVVPLSPEN